MSILAWRIIKSKHAKTAFTGDGARMYGGRWNSPGTAVVYTAGSMSLAILETIVHLQTQDILQDYVAFEVSFDESLMESLDLKALPSAWRRSPSSATVQQIGDDWVAKGRSAVLRLPSVMVPTEWNCLLNPMHSDFSRITIGPKQPIRFDPRLIKHHAP